MFNVVLTKYFKGAPKYHFNIYSTGSGWANPLDRSAYICHTGRCLAPPKSCHMNWAKLIIVGLMSMPRLSTHSDKLEVSGSIVSSFQRKFSGFLFDMARIFLSTLFYQYPIGYTYCYHLPFFKRTIILLQYSLSKSKELKNRNQFNTDDDIGWP